MNNLEKLKLKTIEEDNYKFGLSTLHAYLNFFECFKNISYKLEIKKWQARSEFEKKSVEKRKQMIQQEFRSQLNLLVDKVQPGGSGTSNDGNTARKFFKYYEKASEITGINKILIYRCGVILRVMSSGFEIDSAAFKNYCSETAKMYVELYNWYYMPVTVHKILIHGADVIKKFLLPIGQLSEEAQESRNKDLKLFRRHHTRKNSRQNSNLDLMHHLFVTSDPLITSLRELKSKKRSKLSHDELCLLLPSSDC